MDQIIKIQALEAALRLAEVGLLDTSQSAAIACGEYLQAMARDRLNGKPMQPDTIEAATRYSVEIGRQLTAQTVYNHDFAAWLDAVKESGQAYH